MRLNGPSGVGGQLPGPDPVGEALWLADEVVVLDRGRVAARGTHAQLLAAYQPYRRAFQHETADATAVA